MTIMQKLATLIDERLKERSFCLVFAPDLERCWPSKTFARAEQAEQIQAFAKSNGWSVSVLGMDDRIRAIFR